MSYSWVLFQLSNKAQDTLFVMSDIDHLIRLMEVLCRDKSTTAQETIQALRHSYHPGIRIMKIDPLLQGLIKSFKKKAFVGCLYIWDGCCTCVYCIRTYKKDKHVRGST